ncbi:hypothetical protein [Nocardia sp. NPDC059154]|uniref:hypothetical protein n=1 Tax=Nocardia sp. NPDC059154 TaxID=3346744 RepID=UPI00368737C2
MSRRGDGVIRSLLAELFVEQFDAAGLVESFDLVELKQTRDDRLGGEAMAQVIALGVEKACPILRERSS